MTYPLFIRKRVITYIEEGKSKASASRKFNISLDTIHRWWINREDIFPKRKRVGDVDSAKRPRTSLIGGYLNNKLIAPVLFDGNCNAHGNMIFRIL